LCNFHKPAVCTQAKYGLQTGAGKFMLATLESMLDMNYECYTICILLIFCIC